jgi:hypothetical protein
MTPDFPTPPCRRPALGAIAGGNKTLAIAARAPVRGCCRLVGYTTTAYPLRVLLQGVFALAGLLQPRPAGAASSCAGIQTEQSG